jgi:plastocyanin
VKALVALSAVCAACGGLAFALGGHANAAVEPCQPGDTKIAITNYAFSPDPLTVLPGTTVCWTNNDVVTHNVTSVAPGAFESGPIGIDQSYRQTFPAVGSFPYVCTLHVGMTAQLNVSTTAPPPPPPGPPPGPPPPPPGSPPPPPASATRALAVTRFVVSLRRSNGARWVVARVTVNKAAKARLSLIRRGKTVSTAARSLRRRQNVVRLRVAARRHGLHTVRLQVGALRRTRSLFL